MRRGEEKKEEEEKFTHYSVLRRAGAEGVTLGGDAARGGLSQANQAGSVRRVEGESSGNVKKINVNVFISHIHTCTCRRLQ